MEEARSALMFLKQARPPTVETYNCDFLLQMIMLFFHVFDLSIFFSCYLRDFISYICWMYYHRQHGAFLFICWSVSACETRPTSTTFFPECSLLFFVTNIIIVFFLSLWSLPIITILIIIFKTFLFIIYSLIFLN